MATTSTRPDGPHSDALPLTPSMKRRFYPPLVLLESLGSLTQFRRRNQLDPPISLNQGLENFFEHYSSKLAFLGSTEPGGGAVSACVVLQLPDRVQYVFGFNNHTASQLAIVRQGMTSLISMLQSPLPTTLGGKEALQARVLDAALSLNKMRVRSYLRSLKRSLQLCVDACDRDGSESARVVQVRFQELIGSVRDALCAEQKVLDISCTKEVIKSIGRLYKSDVFPTIEARLVRENSLQTSTYWSESLHTAGRLLSYKQAVDVALEASRVWPELFDAFEVIMIPSSTVIPSPLPLNPWTAEQITRRMTSEASILKEFATQAETLQRYGLDACISKTWTEPPVKPIVHAEVLLHNYLENTEGGTRPERFFMHIKFIGSSKPPCKLCSYFFDEYPTDVKVRPTHGNLYLNWRMPDIYVHQGGAAKKNSETVMDRIKKRVCDDIARTLKESLADGRLHDSSNYASIQSYEAIDASNGISTIDATTMRLTSLAITEGSSAGPSLGGDQTVASTSDVLDENDVLVFQGRRRLVSR